MKPNALLITPLIIAFLFFSFKPGLSQTLKKMGKAAERTAERKLEQKTAKTTEAVIDSILESPGKTKGNQNSRKTDSLPDPPSGEAIQTSASETTGSTITGSQFFPGGPILFADAFEDEPLGDFPVGWETNSGAEVIEKTGKRGLRLYANSLCVPQINDLPENYAIEFDLLTDQLNYKGLSGSYFRMQFVPKAELNKDSKPQASISFSLWAGSGPAKQLQIATKGTGSDFSNTVSFDMSRYLNNTAHLTLVVNGSRLRFFVNNEKALDLPGMLRKDLAKQFRFYLQGTDKNLGHIVAIQDIKITEEARDIRSQLMSGGFSSNAIQFETDSDKLNPSSFRILDQLGTVLQAEKSLRIKIIGHTDSDGDDQSNLELSSRRARAVKKYFEEKFSIPGSRMLTEGMGEEDPVASNNSAEGKAANRRVEFKKL